MTYDEINEARLLLGLPERASLAEIKANYKMLMTKWHPDKCGEDPETCEEMSKKIIAANKVIMDYCGNYRFSFSKEEILEHATEEDFWLERFGKDSSWGVP
ncbi:MAG: J domain-containing protein [Actinobacteria bacterium]|nr:J domain-containing protein [Actinomycetota bacterium]